MCYDITNVIISLVFKITHDKIDKKIITLLVSHLTRFQVFHRLELINCWCHFYYQISQYSYTYKFIMIKIFSLILFLAHQSQLLMCVYPTLGFWCLLTKHIFIFFSITTWSNLDVILLGWSSFKSMSGDLALHPRWLPWHLVHILLWWSSIKIVSVDPVSYPWGIWLS